MCVAAARVRVRDQGAASAPPGTSPALVGCVSPCSGCVTGMMIAKTGVMKLLHAVSTMLAQYLPDFLLL